jgi:hypothetical protein
MMPRSTGCGQNSSRLDGNAVAEALSGQSLEIARRQEGNAFELRRHQAGAALAAPRQARRRTRPPRPALYAWFTEGFDTRDLRDAKALLDALS